MNVLPVPAGLKPLRAFSWVQPVVSPRARGLSVRLNLNPDGRCNFDCVYCDVNRRALDPTVQAPEVRPMMEELSEVLDLIEAGEGGSLPGCEGAPREYLRLGHVALSGNGEPTLCPLFEEVVEELLHLRAQSQHGCFKIALITNATGFQKPSVQRSLRRLMSTDEIWAKLDAGSADWFQQLNRPEVEFQAVLSGLGAAAQQRPVVIQSLFPRWQGRAVPTHEQEAYVQRLASLQQAGARIRLVQIYSASRPPAVGKCSHATLAELSSIARRVKEVTGLPVQVY